MDPNANLEELRRLIARIQAAQDRDDGGAALDNRDVWRLAELAQALDGWLCQGGFLPKAWERKP